METTFLVILVATFVAIAVFAFYIVLKLYAGQR